MKRDEKFFNRLLDVIENDIVPQTLRGVKMGSKVFGAALLDRQSLDLVVASTNHEASSPLWHGEVYAIKEFYELQKHPSPEKCLMLATHQPCCMCASSIAWAGFPEVWYLFGYEQTGADFNIPHDQKMIKDIFQTSAPNPDNDYYKMRGLMDLLPLCSDRAAAETRLGEIRRTYKELSDIYQAGEKTMALS